VYYSHMLTDPFVIYAGNFKSGKMLVLFGFYKQISFQQKRTLLWILIFDEKQEKSSLFKLISEGFLIYWNWIQMRIFKIGFPSRVSGTRLPGHFPGNRVLGYPTKLPDTRTRVINWYFTKFSHSFWEVFGWKILISKYFLIKIHCKTVFLNFYIKFWIFNKSLSNLNFSMDNI
jgi:hypothetical protein